MTPLPERATTWSVRGVGSMVQTGIGVSAFGVTADGRAVQKVTLGAGDLVVALLTYGSVLQSVRLAGHGQDLTLGSDSLADYEGPLHYHGALVGPVANRIAGAEAVLDGSHLRFPANQDGGHILHSADIGTHRKVWRLAEVTDDSCTLTLTLPDGEGGFPGTRRVTARWVVERPATLRLELSVMTDAPTLINFVNHSYWNLDGSETWDGHRLRIAAEHILPVDADILPTGEIAPVAGSAYDLRSGRALVPGQPPLDHCFVLGQGRETLRDVLWLTGRSGIGMTMATTEPGVQVYDGRAAIRPGRGAYEGLAIEAQFWPDAPRHPAFPSIRLDPGEMSVQVTEWRFTA